MAGMILAFSWCRMLIRPPKGNRVRTVLGLGWLDNEMGKSVKLRYAACVTFQQRRFNKWFFGKTKQYNHFESNDLQRNSKCLQTDGECP
jgi:hypothetical protein